MCIDLLSIMTVTQNLIANFQIFYRCGQNIFLLEKLPKQLQNQIGKRNDGAKRLIFKKPDY